MATIILTKDGAVLQKIPLLKGRTTVGRRTYNDVVVDDPGISAEHAVFVTNQGDPYFEDLKSTNGSQINGHPIQKHILQDRDVITLGRYAIEYRADANGVKTLSPATEISIAENLGDLHQSTTPVYDDPNFDGINRARVQILNGHKAGQMITITETLTTIGRPDIHMAAMTRNEKGHCLTHIYGGITPVINGKAIEADMQVLKNGDLIDLAGTKLLFMN
jgi:hypothetical protein